MGRLSVGISLHAPDTRAVSSFTEMKDYEEAANKVEILVFDENGDINLYENVADAALTANLNVTHGTKTVYAVVNSPVSLSNIKTAAALEDVGIILSDNSIDKTKGFVMVGKKTDVTVGASTDPCPIAVSRHTARITLASVKSELPQAYGDLKIVNIFLTNVVGKQNLGGDADAGADAWYNQMGRVTNSKDKTHIIDGVTYMATDPTLTFSGADITVGYNATQTPNLLFYTYPNSNSTPLTGWTDSFNGAATRLVLAAEITTGSGEAETYYYPVPLPALVRNNTYDVSVTITGLGLDDPEGDIQKDAINVSVSINGWTPGDAIKKEM